MGKGAAQKHRVRHVSHFKHTMEFLKLGNAKIRPENMVLRATRDAWNIRVCGELRAGGGALHAAEFNFAELEKHEAEYEAAFKE